MKIFTLLFCLALSYFLQAQTLRIATTPVAIASQVPGYSEVSTINTKTISYTPSVPPTPTTPVDDDSTTEDDKIYHYADIVATSIDMNDGNITSTSAGKVWTLRISIPSALNVGFVFSSFNLSPAAEMYIFDEGRTVLDSNTRAADFVYTGNVGVAPIRGSALIIYIVEINNSGSLLSSVAIQNVEAGFQDIYDVGDTGETFARGASINCDPMIQCQQSRLFSARAVARVFSNGKAFTGTLINNEANNGRAFFLTCFHGIDVGGGFFGGGDGVINAGEEAALLGARFQFRFWRTNCNGSINNSFIQFNGAVIRARSNSTDVVLLELLDAPGVGDQVNYAGWTRSTSAPADDYSYIIHHPEAEDMRVTSTRSVNSWFWNNKYWTAKYSSGTVTGGSSGSALFNEFGQITGQLRSGWSSCNFTDFGDRYGKFDRSWDGAGLQTWLSPTSGLGSTNTLILSPITITGLDAIDCSNTSYTYSVPNLLGCSYVWTVPNSLNVVSGQNTASIVVTRNTALPFSSGQLSVTINDSKGRVRTVTVTKNFNIGLPVITGVNVTTNYCLGGSDWELGLEANTGNQNVSQYIWTRDGSVTGQTSSSFYTYEFPPSCMSIGVSAVNACGTGPALVQTFCPPCGGFRMNVSPNPVKDEAVVVIANDEKLKQNKSAGGKIKLTLVNSTTGQVIRSWILPEQQQYRISLAGVKKGNYTLVALVGTAQVSKQVVVQ